MRNLLMFVVALSLSSFALAQNHLYLGAKAGYMNWDDDRFADSDDEDGGNVGGQIGYQFNSSTCLLYTSPSPRDRTRSRMPSSA